MPEWKTTPDPSSKGYLNCAPGNCVGCQRRGKVLQGGHAVMLQRALGKRDCSQNDKMNRGGILLFSEMARPSTF